MSVKSIAVAESPKEITHRVSVSATPVRLIVRFSTNAAVMMSRIMPLMRAIWLKQLWSSASENFPLRQTKKRAGTAPRGGGGGGDGGGARIGATARRPPVVGGRQASGGPPQPGGARREETAGGAGSQQTVAGQPEWGECGEDFCRANPPSHGDD